MPAVVQHLRYALKVIGNCYFSAISFAEQSLKLD